MTGQVWNLDTEITGVHIMYDHIYPPMQETGVKHKGGKAKMSGERDHSIGQPNRKGMAHKEEESNFSEQEMAETGLVKREPI